MTATETLAALAGIALVVLGGIVGARLRGQRANVDAAAVQRKTAADLLARQRADDDRIEAEAAARRKTVDAAATGPDRAAKLAADEAERMRRGT